MTEDLDEEVVFENSPLFQYLQDLGHTDFEACSPISQEQEEELSSGAQDILPPSRPGGIWRLAEILHSLSPFRQSGAPLQLEQQLDAAFRQYSLRCVLSQDVLLQEDVELIELLDPSALSLGSTSTACPSATSALPAPRYLSTPSIWDVSVLVGLVAILLTVWCSCHEDRRGLLWLCVCAVCVLCVRHGIHLWHKAAMQQQVQAQAVQLESLVINSRALTSLARKSLRLIQETEVISRGFTLVSAACPFNRAGHLRSQQLIGLRKAAYQSLRCAFRASRIATCIMLKSYPPQTTSALFLIDNVTNYVSTVPIRELGLGLGAEHLSDEQAQELTNDYSLPALKLLFQLWVGQSSEFFRRLALMLSSGRAELESKPRLLAYNSVATVTASLHPSLACCLGDLQRSYEFHRYFEMQQQAQNSGRASRARQKCRELNSLHTSIRSLQLHLRALLSEVIILEDELEKLMVAKELEEVTCAGYQELRERLHLLQPHMQASSCCWEDMTAQVERMLRRVTQCPGSGDSPEEAAGPAPPPPAPISHIDDTDPVPEEQELEAYVSDSDSDSEWRGAVDMLSPWERERQRREREESRRVLLELKSVLGIRTSEGERDKRKLLLFSDKASVGKVATETSDHYPESSASPGCTDLAASASNHISQQPSGGEGEELEEGGEETERDSTEDREADAAVTEFCCGDSESAAETQDKRGEAEGTRLFQSDGLMDEEAGPDGSHPLTPRVPTLSVIDRLTELHGSEVLSIGSALAAQVAARSHTFTHLQECTYGDSDEEEEEEEEGEKEVTSQPDEMEAAEK
ncbi:hypothetical protein PHYPO_G00088210 [Pangasianodon hypophthalmus]|uniref:Vezatin n=1 Tax=Pangasianodon hypophthalmus TaxID=310915 RepID=A0A5N5LIX6_PANHP|nr:hypothetical protein PHYPO_G00088210 [Pangasianodon hypophthalmus]